MSLVFTGKSLGWGKLETVLMSYEYQYINKFKIKISTQYNGVYTTNPIFNDLELPEILSVFDKCGYHYLLKSRKSKNKKCVYKYFKLVSEHPQPQPQPESLLIAKINFLLQCALNANRKYIFIPSSNKIKSSITNAIDEFNKRESVIIERKTIKDIKSVEKRQLVLHVTEITQNTKHALKVWWD